MKTYALAESHPPSGTCRTSETHYFIDGKRVSHHDYCVVWNKAKDGKTAKRADTSQNNGLVVVWAWHTDEYGDTCECTKTNQKPEAWEVYTRTPTWEIRDEQDFPTLEAALREALKRCDATGYSLDIDGAV